MKSMIKDLNGDVFEGKLTNIMAAVSEIFLTIEARFLSMRNKKENGEEINMEEFIALSSAFMHCSHAIGELMETKAAVFGEENLNIMDRKLLSEYEKEMETHLKAFIERNKFDDILNGEENND